MQEEPLTFRQKIYNYLLFLTNNEKKSAKEWRQDEIHFDMGFLIAGFIFLLLGLAGIVFYLATKQDLYLGIMFGCEFCICFIWLFDNIRHNRED